MWLAQWATQVQWLAPWPCSELATCGQAVEVTCAASEDNDLAMSIAQIRGSIVVSIPACHAEDPGSIPGRGVLFFCSSFFTHVGVHSHAIIAAHDIKYLSICLMKGF